MTRWQPVHVSSRVHLAGAKLRRRLIRHYSASFGEKACTASFFASFELGGRVLHLRRQVRGLGDRVDVVVVRLPVNI